MTDLEKDLAATLEMVNKENLTLKHLLLKAEERIAVLEAQLALKKRLEVG